MSRALRNVCLMALTTAGLSCVPGSSPIRIRGTFPITGTAAACDISGDLSYGRGRLDASGGGDYVLVLSIDSEAAAEPQVLSNRGVELTGPGKHNFIVDSLSLTYRAVTSTNSVIPLDAEQIAIAAQIPPSTVDNRLTVDIIGDKAAARLRDQVSDPAVSVLLTVNMQLRGHLESGESVQSNVFSFQIEVTTTNAGCAEPGSVVHNGPCGAKGGQDGSMVTCCPAGSPPSGC